MALAACWRLPRSTEEQFFDIAGRAQRAVQTKAMGKDS